MVHRRIGIVLAGALAGLGCGGRVPLDAVDAVDGAATGDVAVEAEVGDGTDDARDAAPTPEDACRTLTVAICEEARDCCVTETKAFSRETCQKNVSAWCNRQTSAVADGRRVFDGAALDTCVGVWRSHLRTCAVTYRSYYKTYPACLALFRGLVAPGGSCADPHDCAAPGGSFSTCSAASKCTVIRTVGNGEWCGWTGATASSCDEGLFCDSADGKSGICRPARAPGSSCAGVDDASCGYLYTCRDAKCVAGAAKGAMCTRPLECASWSCVEGTCTDPYLRMAGPWLCGVSVGGG